MKPVPQRTGFGDGEIPVKQKETIPPLSIIEQGWNISSKVAVVICHNDYNRRKGPEQMSSTKPDRSENYGREQVPSWWKAGLLRPAVKTDSFIREGLNVH